MIVFSACFFPFPQKNTRFRTFEQQLSSLRMTLRRVHEVVFFIFCVRTVLWGASNHTILRRCVIWVSIYTRTVRTYVLAMVRKSSFITYGITVADQWYSWYTIARPILHGCVEWLKSFCGGLVVEYFKEVLIKLAHLTPFSPTCILFVM